MYPNWRKGFWNKGFLIYSHLLFKALIQMQVLKKMKNLLHGKVSFFVMAADFIPVWYLKGNAVSLQDKLHSKELLIYDAG